MAKHDDALVTIKNRNEFHRDGYRRAQKIIVGLSVALAAMTAVNAGLAFVVARGPERTFFAATEDGRVIQLTPLNEPLLSDERVLAFAAEAAPGAHTFDFSNFRAELQESSKDFTTRGFQSFIKALETSGNLDAVVKRKLAVTAVPTQAPVIVARGLVNGVYTWRLQMPMLVTFQSASEVVKDDITVELTVVRRPTTESPKGIGIDQFVARG
jgi:intracellular multiplication protein IcmL